MLREMGCLPRARSLRGRDSDVGASWSSGSSLARDARSSSLLVLLCVSVDVLVLGGLKLLSSLPLSMVKSRRASKRERDLRRTSTKRRFSGQVWVSTDHFVSDRQQRQQQASMQHHTFAIHTPEN